ncbi:MAG: WD40 repeat domain-containing protein [Pleurocapsa minor GSE-CHR-MK-17-07R]|nr:WD40 repeat domain-containing protein [Pleurocapsa minor GSE-CHR-MK 17-07R]
MHPAGKRICLSGIILSLIISLPTLGAAQPDPLQIEWFQVSTDYVVDVDWSLDGQYIATGNSTENELRIFDWENETYIWSYIFEPSSGSRYFPEFLVRWSPDGRYIASISGGKVYIIDFQSRSLMRMIDVSLISRDDLSNYVPHAGHMDWSSDSSRLAVLSTDGYIDIFSIESGSILQTIDIVLDPGMYGGEGISYQIFDWSIDDSWFAVPNYIPNMPLTATMGFWDGSGQFIEAFATTNEAPDHPLCPVYGRFNYEVQAVEWANDSRTLAVGGSYGYGVCVLTVDGTIENEEISTVPTSSLAWSPDQRWIASIFGACFVAIREPVSGAVVDESTIPASDSCVDFSIRWSPDSRYIAVATNRGLWVGRVTEPSAGR